MNSPFRMVEVFKTNITCAEDADKVIRHLLLIYPSFNINFDMEDCDNILRVEGIHISGEEILIHVLSLGYRIEVLI